MQLDAQGSVMPIREKHGKVRNALPKILMIKIANTAGKALRRDINRCTRNREWNC
jgi:hypothetical protein